MEWNVQQHLELMEENRRRDHQEMLEKVDNIKVAINNHDGRLLTLELDRRIRIWITRTGIAAIVTSVVDLLFNHLPKIFTK